MPEYRTETDHVLPLTAHHRQGAENSKCPTQGTAIRLGKAETGAPRPRQFCFPSSPRAEPPLLNPAAPSLSHTAGVLSSGAWAHVGHLVTIPTGWGAKLQAHREGRKGADYLPTHNRVFHNVVIHFFSMEFFITSASRKLMLSETHEHTKF